MKHIFIVLLTLYAFVANSQVEYTTYNAANKPYRIDLSYKDTVDYVPWIILRCGETHSGGISLKRSQIEPFREALFEAQLKYEEWTQVAKDNKVEYMQHREMKIKPPLVDAFYPSPDDAEWKFKFNIPIKFYFVVTKQGNEVLYLLYFSTGIMETNEVFVKIGALYQYLSSSAQIEQLSMKLSDSEIVDFIKQPKQTDLFKD